jgi:pilus assembly protein CpaF
MIILSLSEKGGETQQLEFDKTDVTVGRVQGNDIVLPKGNVSKKHSRIILKANAFSVEDMKSTNGTYVNGRKIAGPTPLFQGDKLYIGDFIIRVENAPAPEAANLGNEAGSLSSALHRRKDTAEAPIVDDLARKPTLPPPPPRKDTSVPPPPSGSTASALPDVPPPGMDLDLDDDEPLATAPPAPSPPVMAPPPPAAPKPAPLPPPVVAPVAAPVVAVPPPAPRPRNDSEVPTSNRDRAVVAPSQISDPSNPRAWLQRLLDDQSVSAIFVVGPESVVIERAGLRESITLGDSEINQMVETVSDLARKAGVNMDGGVVDAVLAGGARITGLLPPAASRICVGIRRSSESVRTLLDLADSGTIHGPIREALEACVSFQRNVLVVGDKLGTAAVLEALGQTIPSSMRVLSQGGRVGSADPGQAWVDLKVDANAADHLRVALAAHPDFLIADVTSAAIGAEVVRQLSLGHQGAVVSLLARSSTDALARLEALLIGTLGSAETVRALLASAFEAIVFVVATPDGKVKVMEFAEPHLVDSALTARILFSHAAGKFEASGKASKLGGTLARLGKPVSGLGG